MRFLIAVGAVGAALASAGDTPALEDLIVDDDLCEEGAGSEECSLSFRQLRGQVRLHDHAAAAGEDNGFCCYAWSDNKDIGGSCYPTAKAKPGEYCASDKTCSGCGGTWVKMRCVFSGADESDICGTAFDTAVANEGDFCSQSEKACVGDCKGHWCVSKQAMVVAAKADEAATATASEPAQEQAAEIVPPKEDEPAAASEQEAPSLLKVEAVVANATNETGFCCHAATKGTCGTCYPTAKAKPGDYCATSTTCGECGGTWCEMRCVYSGSDPADVCGSAYDTAIAKSDEYCGQSGEVCESAKCNGHWCAATNATVPIKKQHEDKKSSRRRRRRRRHHKHHKKTTTAAAAAEEDESAMSTTGVPAAASAADESSAATAPAEDTSSASATSAAAEPDATPAETAPAETA